MVTGGMLSVYLWYAMLIQNEYDKTARFDPKEKVEIVERQQHNRHTSFTLENKQQFF